MKLKEVAADTLALGSIPFFLIVMARSTVGDYWLFVIQLLIAGVALYIISKFYKEVNWHLARGLILIVFTIIFYKDLSFSIFAGVLYLAMLVSAYLIKHPVKKISAGVLAGAVCSTIAYYIAPYLNSLLI